jgi:flagellar biogenesis protein FliO
MALAGVLGLAGIAGLYLKRRRKSGHTPSGSIELVATQSLGPKAKVVWLTTGERELIVAVGETGPRLLSSWRKRAPVRAVGTQPLPRGGAEPASFEHSVLPRARTINTSPAVAGLVKLREQSPAPINEEVATDDPEADAEWARELLKATRQDLRAS